MPSHTQHGRQPPPQPAAPPTDPRTDPRTRRVEERVAPAAAAQPPDPPQTRGICRDFIWGICQMGAQCKYRHDYDFEAMKAVLKFCHDHQNRTGCLRPDCTYLHTSRDEENAFLAHGLIPRMLLERYSSITATAVPVTAGVPSGDSGPVAPLPVPAPHVPVGPPHVMYEYLTQPPPPPPPPPPPTTRQNGTIQPPMQGPLLHGLPMQGPQMVLQMQGPQMPIQGPQMQIPPMQGPSMQGTQIQGPSIQGPQMQGLMMPNQTMLAPPPPPPPPTASITSMQAAGPSYTASMPTSRAMPGQYNTQPPPLPIFDPTRPPPSLHPRTPNSNANKRPTQDDSQAGPSKVRKSDNSNDSSCECCVERLLRSNVYAQQIEQQQQQNEQMRIAYANRVEDYERKKNILRTLLRPEVYHRTEKYIENGSSMPFAVDWTDNPLSPFTISSVPSSSNSSNSTILHQLLDVLINTSNSTSNSRSESRDFMSSEDMNEFSQDISGHNRSNNSDSESDMQIFFEMLLNSTSDGPTIVEPRQVELDLNRASTSTAFSRFLGDSSPPPAPAPTGASRYPAHAPPPPAPVRAYTDHLPGPSRGPGPYHDGAPGVPPYADPPSFLADTRYAEPAAAPPRYPAPPRHYHPGFESATVPAGAPPPPFYVPGHTYTSHAPAPAPPHPPAPRPYYNHFTPSNVPNPPYPDPGIGMTQAPRPPTTGVQTIPQNPQNYPHYMGRFPNQHYYPPHQ